MYNTQELYQVRSGKWDYESQLHANNTAGADVFTKSPLKSDLDRNISMLGM